MSAYETLLTSHEGGVARITLNRPEVRNALSRPLVRELEAALAAAEADDGVRVIVLSGAGDKAFCAGADLKAADDAVFGLPEIKVGLLPLVVMAPILRAVGRKRGLLMILSGEPVSAREAFDMGLVSRVVPRADLERETAALAAALAGFSPTAVALAKEAAFTIQDMDYGKSLRYLRELITLVGMSDDAKEGIAAFFAKRPPEWKGR